MTKKDSIDIGTENIIGYINSPNDIEYKDQNIRFLRAYVLYPVVKIDDETVAIPTFDSKWGEAQILSFKDFKIILEDEPAIRFIEAENINKIAGYIG